jgi:hypothetical protein
MEDAEKLALASQGGGTLSLALRRPGYSEIQPLGRFMLDDPRHYAAPAIAAPRQARGRPAHAGAHGDRTASVTVVSGDASTSVTVPNETARF